MTSDHLFPMLENEGDSQRLVEVASALAMARVPEEIIEAIRLGCLTALSKPDRGVRVIVVGDILRRMVARTLAKQISKKVEEATAPFEYTLSTKAGCECVAHILQSLTDLSPEVTFTSIDGGAYDLISRNAMLEGLFRMEGGDQILPFVHMFYSNPSTYLWEDEPGVTQHITQLEGGEQGDPLMPLLFVLGQHKSLVEAQARLLPDRVSEAHTIVEEELSTHAHIHLHHGKTKVWNRGGVEPEGIAELTRRARQVRPETQWCGKGISSCHPTNRASKCSGSPSAKPEFVLDFLEAKSREHATLFQRIPWVQDTQAAFLLLLMCGSTRANFWLRTVAPELTERFAERHDVSVWRCLSNILGTPSAPDGAQVIATLALSAGGLGLSSAHRVICQLGRLAEDGEEETPHLAEWMIRHLEVGGVPCFLAARQCREVVEEAGLVLPSWTELSHSSPPAEAEPEPNQPQHSWQQKATTQLETRFVSDVVWPGLTGARRALLRSQHGPLASAALTALPSSRATRIDCQPFCQPFRVLLCRRLHLPLPLSHRKCQCGRQLDVFGHHRAACSEAGVLGRGFPLEVAAAQVCREAGARVTTNVFVRDMDLAVFDVMDSRRLEVVADGLTAFRGALVSAIRRDGTARPGAATRAGVALAAARRTKERTYPELTGKGGRARLVVLAAEVGGRWSAETAQFLVALSNAKAESVPELL